MTDRRDTPCNGHVAARHLEGLVDAERFVEGIWKQVTAFSTWSCAAPGAAGDRNLNLGQRFCVLEEVDGYAFGYAEADGYVGYVPARDLSDPAPVTHRVIRPQTLAKAHPDLKHFEPQHTLCYGAAVRVVDVQNEWSGFEIQGQDDTAATLYVPTSHLVPVDHKASDFVAEAEKFLGLPYLWGGNTGLGLDCSGLVQLALHAAGHECPRDSDQQRAALGEALPKGATLQRGDLIFWVGHVGILQDGDTLLHANAHHMAVATEPLAGAIARIGAKEFGDVVARKRL